MRTLCLDLHQSFQDTAHKLQSLLYSTANMTHAGEEIEASSDHPVLTEAHATYLQYHSHRMDSGIEGEDITYQHSFPQLQKVPKTGERYATLRAKESGFSPSDENWANMGQGKSNSERIYSVRSILSHSLQ